MATLQPLAKGKNTSLNTPLVGLAKEVSSNSHITSDSFNLYPATDREDKPRFSYDLRPDSHYFKPYQEFLDDILDIVRNGVVDLFKLNK